MRPTILNQFGKPVAWREFYEGGNRWRKPDVKAVHYHQGFTDTNSLLSVASWKELVNMGRFLMANVPIVRGALVEQCNLSFPLEPYYTGADKSFADKAETWVDGWRKISNVKGSVFTPQVCSRIRTIARKVDGDFATHLTFTDGGYPKLEFIRAHRIGDRGETELKGGPYKGRRIRNGVVLSPFGAPLAYLVLGETEDQDRYIPASDMILTYDPDVSDIDRGISELCASISSFEDIKRLREYEMRAQQLGASIGLIEKNDTGLVDDSAAAILRDTAGAATAGTAAGLVTETYESGTIRYFKSGTGNGLEAFRNDRPSADAMAFEDRIVSCALYGIGWDPNFAVTIKEPGGAWARTIIEKVRRTILRNQELEAAAQKREIVWATAKAIKLGILPKPSDGDIFSWEFKAPARITADAGNEANAKREAYKLGLETMRDLQAEQGRWWQEVRAQKQVEAVDLLTRCREIQSQFPELTLQECRHLMEQRESTSPPAQVQQSQQSAE